MSIRIGAKPDSDFNNPLGLLKDCHRRIERFLDQLLAVAEQNRGGELSLSQREALSVSLRYFQRAAPLHTQDEEQSLFPRMRSARDENEDDVLTALDRLGADHERASALHLEVERLGARWLDSGRLPEHDAEKLIVVMRSMRALYREHIQFEDTQVFPLAGRILDAHSIEEVGREMALRRGIDADNPPELNRCAARREQARPSEIRA